MSIRRQPGDFSVREQLLADVVHQAESHAAATATHRHGLWELRKTSLTTPEASGMLAKALGLKPSAVQHAGLKDKHALTVQHVSVECANMAAAQRTPREAGAAHWSARLLGFLDRHVTAESIEANAFDILVTDLSVAAAQLMHTRSRMLATGAEPVSSLRVINYFGDQRFGSARHGGGFAARRLIDGDFEGALKLLIGTPARKDTGGRRALTRACAQHWGDWAKIVQAAPRTPERRPIEVLSVGGTFIDAFTALPYFVQQMAVDAYQSYLWNATAARLVGQLNDASVFAADDDFGSMVFVPGLSMPEAWVGMPLSVPAHDARYADERVQSAVNDVLEAEQLTLPQLRIPTIRRPQMASFGRTLAVEAKSFEILRSEPDPVAGGKRVQVRVRFELPRGSYATVVLRALGQ